MSHLDAVPRIITALVTGATFMGMALVVLGQAVFDPFAESVERLFGGSVLLVATVLIVRWTFKLWKETRQAATEDRESFLKREEALINQIAELNAQLRAERRLRISLEEAGIIDRRHPFEDSF